MNQRLEEQVVLEGDFGEFVGGEGQFRHSTVL
jgi:hypothetical protein